MDAQTQAFLHYYNSQSGGQLPIFHGARRAQHGAGLGNFFGGLARTIFPIAAAGLGSFLNSMLQKREEGASWKDSAKSAIAPSARVVLNRALDSAASSSSSSSASSAPAPTDQAGSGRRRGRKRRSGSTAASAPRKRKRTLQGLPQKGGGRTRKRARRTRKKRTGCHYKKRAGSGLGRNSRLHFLNF